jgi:hypothetical protein
MFCINNQCGYTSSLPSLSKDWETLWEEEIDKDKLTDSQNTFLTGLFTIEEINTEIVKLKYKMPAPPNPLNNLISQESINTQDWKEVKQINRNPFKTVHCNNDTVKVSSLGTARKIDTHPRNSELAMVPWGDSDAMEIATTPPPRTKRQIEEVIGTSSASGGKSRKKMAKDVASSAV